MFIDSCLQKYYKKLDGKTKVATRTVVKEIWDKRRSK